MAARRRYVSVLAYRSLSIFRVARYFIVPIYIFSKVRGAICVPHFQAIFDTRTNIFSILAELRVYWCVYAFV